MLWLFFSIIAYFLLAVVTVIDEILLTGRVIKPKVYAFYIALLGLAGLILIPFGFKIPSPMEIGLSLLSGFLWIFAILSLYEGLRLYEVSIIVPAVGAILPILTLGLTYLFSWQAQETMASLNYPKLISFIFLILGSVFLSWQKDISLEKKKAAFKKVFSIAIVTAFLFALSFTTAKFVYLGQSFVSGFVWMRMGGFLAAILLVFSKDVQKEFWNRKKRAQGEPKPLFQKPKIAVLFIFNQLLGGGAVVLQNLAIFLAPLSFLAFINALEGIKYVFILVLTIIFSLRFPQILFEKISRQVLGQKFFAVVLIITGLIILALN